MHENTTVSPGSAMIGRRESVTVTLFPLPPKTERPAR